LNVYTIADNSRCPSVYGWATVSFPSNVKAGYLARLGDTKGAPLVTGVELRDRGWKTLSGTNREFERFYVVRAREETIVDMIRHETCKIWQHYRSRARDLIASLAQRYRGQSFPREELVEVLYDSHGVPPEIVAAVGNKIGTKRRVARPIFTP